MYKARALQANELSIYGPKIKKDLIKDYLQGNNELGANAQLSSRSNASLILIDSQIKGKNSKLKIT